MIVVWNGTAIGFFKLVVNSSIRAAEDGRMQGRDQ